MAKKKKTKGERLNWPLIKDVKPVLIDPEKLKAEIKPHDGKNKKFLIP